MTSQEPPTPTADPIERAQAAYARGDFATLRAQAGSPDGQVPEVRALATQTTVDSWVWGVLGICLAIFTTLVAVYAH